MSLKRILYPIERTLAGIMLVCRECRWGAFWKAWAVLLLVSAAWGQTCDWDAVEPTCGASDPSICEQLHREWAAQRLESCFPSGTIMHATIPESEPTCDQLQPPGNGDWDAYEIKVRQCYSELMVEYVMEAAKNNWGDWCNGPPEAETRTLLSCWGPPPQDRVDEYAKELLEQDRALLRRLLKLLAAGEEIQ